MIFKHKGLSPEGMVDHSQLSLIPNIDTGILKLMLLLYNPTRDV